MKSRNVKKLYDSLEPTLGLECTETLVSFIDEKIVTEMDNRISQLVTKQEFQEAQKASMERDNDLAIRMEKGFRDLETRFERRFGEIETRFEKKLGELETRIERRFGELEIRLQKEFGRIEGKISNIYKWMFVCWITQILAVLGFLKYFIR